jgi:hypothetical protein
LTFNCPVVFTKYSGPLSSEAPLTSPVKSPYVCHAPVGYTWIVATTGPSVGDP